MKRLLVTAASLTVLATTVGCAPAPDSSPSGQGSTKENGPSRAALSEYYEQELSWQSCEEYAIMARTRKLFARPALECARLTVPLDYSEPRGETITIGVLRSPGESAGQRIGSLVLNPGGPGSSGMQSAAAFADSFAATELDEHFDLVGFDPRAGSVPASPASSA